MRSLFHSVALGGEAKSTVDSLRMHIFLNFEFCIPPVTEQAQILEWIEQEEARFDTLFSARHAPIGVADGIPRRVDPRMRDRSAGRRIKDK